MLENLFWSCWKIQLNQKTGADAEVEVECNNRGVRETEVGRTTAWGAFSITLQDYDFEALGSNGCKAKLKSSLNTTCTVPTNRGGGLTGTDLVLKEKSKDMVILTAGPFAFQQSKVKATRAVSRENLQSNTDDKYSSGSSLPAVSGLWYAPPENNYYTYPSPAHYESPNHHENRGDHESHKDIHRRSEHEGRQGSSGERTDHKARDKDCSSKSGSHHYKTPPHHSVPNYEKSPPTYHSEHHNTPSPHESSSSHPPPCPHYDAPPYVPYVHHAPLPPHDGYKSPPPPDHDNYEAPPKQYDPPPYYQRGNVDTTAKAASAQPKESSPWKGFQDS